MDFWLTSTFSWSKSSLYKIPPNISWIHMLIIVYLPLKIAQFVSKSALVFKVLSLKVTIPHELCWNERLKQVVVLRKEIELWVLCWSTATNEMTYAQHVSTTNGQTGCTDIQIVVIRDELLYSQVFQLRMGIYKRDGIISLVTQAGVRSEIWLCNLCPNDLLEMGSWSWVTCFWCTAVHVSS